MSKLVKLAIASIFVLGTFAPVAQARVNMDQPHAGAAAAPQSFSKKLRLNTPKRAHSKASITIKPRRTVGYVMELVVGCPTSDGSPRKSGIIAFSKLDRTFCEPNQACHRSAVAAAASICKISPLKSTLRLNTR